MENILLFQDGLLLFFGKFFIEIEHVVLISLVIIAAISDIKTRKIPNKLVFPGAIFAIAFNAFSPYGIGTINALAGLAVGLAALLPLYMMRAMGAGDVKLMAMIGAFLGPASTLGAIFTTLICGGVLSIAGVIKNKSSQRMFNNIRFAVIQAFVGITTGSNMRTDIMSVSAGKLPYGIAIAAGTTIHLFLIKKGHALFL